MGLPLEESDEPNRYWIPALSSDRGSRLTSAAKTCWKSAAATAAARPYLVRTLHPASYTALDFNASGTGTLSRSDTNCPA